MSLFEQYEWRTVSTLKVGERVELHGNSCPIVSIGPADKVPGWLSLLLRTPSKDVSISYDPHESILTEKFPFGFKGE